MKSRSGKTIQLVISLAVIALAAWIFLNHQLVLDKYTTWQFTPSGEIQKIADRATMTDEGKFYLYASRAELSDSGEFNSHCTNQESHAVILGCYTMQRIYVYNVADERLDGVKEVTAAHEMLHAAYDRLSSAERDRIGELLEQEFEEADDGLHERLRVYDSLSSADRLNELHSILPTEVDILSGELEEYYARYFKERAEVVELFHRYEGAFRGLQQRQEDIAARLNELAESVNVRTVSYNSDVELLNSDVQSFNRRASTPGGFTTQGEFNAERNELIARQGALEAERSGIDAERSEYEQLQEELVLIDTEYQDLQESLDSSPSPLPAI